jgi:hypothetical protein
MVEFLALVVAVEFDAGLAQTQSLDKRPRQVDGNPQ